MIFITPAPDYNLIESGCKGMKLYRLAELRNKVKMSQKEIANFLNVGRTTYSMYEQGHREMPYELLIKLADFYNVSLDYIFERTNNPIHQESYSKDELEFMLKSLELYREIKDKYR